MNYKKAVVSLGHKALGYTTLEQLDAVKITARALADLAEAGYQLTITHSNGPQISMIHKAMTELRRVYTDYTPAPMCVCSAMSQGYIGYHIQQALKYALSLRNRNCPVLTVATQMVVDEHDPGFTNPTKPIGPFYSEEEAKALTEEKGYTMKEDAGRGWRRVVASPIPRRIVEIEAIKKLWDSSIVISCGGGGIPVVERMDGTLEGVAAVIDKDFAAELLAEQVDADVLMILTEVEKVAVNWGKENQQDLDHMSLKEAVQYIEEGQFAPGSMLPKVEAAMKFARTYPDKKAIITSLDKAIDALEGKTGTVITFA